MKTYVGKAKEETGKAPACTGALLKIKRIQRVYVKAGESDWSKDNARCVQYLVSFTIEKPSAAAGVLVNDRILVGTPDDTEAQKPSTWEVSEGGPARLNRLLVRSGTALTKDDEDWSADAVGRTVVAPITHNKNGYVNVGLYYRESDKDCPVIGLADGKTGGTRRPAAAVEDDEDEAPAKAAPPKDEEEDDAPKPKKAKVVEPEPDDDEEEAPKPAKKPAKKAPAAEEEDDD